MKTTVLVEGWGSPWQRITSQIINKETLANPPETVYVDPTVQIHPDNNTTLEVPIKNGLYRDTDEILTKQDSHLWNLLFKAWMCFSYLVNDKRVKQFEHITEELTYILDAKLHGNRFGDERMTQILNFKHALREKTVFEISNIAGDYISDAVSLAANSGNQELKKQVFNLSKEFMDLRSTGVGAPEKKKWYNRLF